MLGFPPPSMSLVTAMLLLPLTVPRTAVSLTPTAVWVWAAVLPQVVLPLVEALLPAPALTLKLALSDG